MSSSGFQIGSAFVDITAKDSTAAGLASSSSSATKSVQSTASAAKASFSTIFGALQSQVGGVLGPLLEVGEGVSRMSETVETHGKTVSGVLLGIGAGALAAGGVLSSMGSQETQAQNQLANAVENTGHSFEEYEDQIESVDKQMEKYGDTSASTDQALQTLTNATHDPTQAINLMGEVADLERGWHHELDRDQPAVGRRAEGPGQRSR
jgi:hypothetical protein